jgi:hypothetical protein
MGESEQARKETNVVRSGRRRPHPNEARRNREYYTNGDDLSNGERGRENVEGGESEKGGAGRDPLNHAPDKSFAALLLIDVINPMEFPEGDELLRHALPAAKRIAALKRRAKQIGIPVIYANDNFGRWRSDFPTLVEHCLENPVRGREVVRLLRPDHDDYFVLFGLLSDQPGHSAQIPGSANADPDRDGGRFLCAIYGKRRLHARVPGGDAGGLRCVRAT